MSKQRVTLTLTDPVTMNGKRVRFEVGALPDGHPGAHIDWSETRQGWSLARYGQRISPDPLELGFRSEEDARAHLEAEINNDETIFLNVQHKHDNIFDIVTAKAPMRDIFQVGLTAAEVVGHIIATKRSVGISIKDRDGNTINGNDAPMLLNELKNQMRDPRAAFLEICEPCGNTGKLPDGERCPACSRWRAQTPA